MFIGGSLIYLIICKWACSLLVCYPMDGIPYILLLMFFAKRGEVFTCCVSLVAYAPIPLDYYTRTYRDKAK
jgi:hypothetical protein